MSDMEILAGLIEFEDVSQHVDLRVLFMAIEFQERQIGGRKQNRNSIHSEERFGARNVMVVVEVSSGYVLQYAYLGEVGGVGQQVHPIAHAH